MIAAALEDDAWQDDARLAILRLSITEQEFTADSLRAVMRPAPVSNWVGIAFTAAKKAGLIEAVGYQTSTSTTRKHGVLRVWRQTNKGVVTA